MAASLLILPTTAEPLPPFAADATTIVEVDGDVVPVFDGVAVLVEDPAAWCGRHRDAVIAALVSAGVVVDLETVTVLEAMAAEAERQTPSLFVDDFTPEEAVDFPPPQLVDEGVQKLLDDAQSPLSWLVANMKPATVVVEVGPGAGGLSSLLAPFAKQLFVVDISLKSVLLARSRARAAVKTKAQREQIRGVVASAEFLPFAAETVDVIVAENIVDLLDDPRGFLTSASVALKAGGTLLLTSPDPDLGAAPDHDDEEEDGDAVDSALVSLLHDAGFDIVDSIDGLRWPRVHGPRHVELWTCVGLRCVKRTTA